VKLVVMAQREEEVKGRRVGRGGDERSQKEDEKY
jgi:hypothetical protein